MAQTDVTLFTFPSGIRRPDCHAAYRPASGSALFLLPPEALSGSVPGWEERPGRFPQLPFPHTLQCSVGPSGRLARLCFWSRPARPPGVDRASRNEVVYRRATGRGRDAGGPERNLLASFGVFRSSWVFLSPAEGRDRPEGAAGASGCAEAELIQRRSRKNRLEFSHCSYFI